MVLLPELVYRWALDRRLLEVPSAWTAVPDQAPVITGEHAAWSRDWYPSAPGNDRPSATRVLASHLPGPLLRKVRSVRAGRRSSSRPTGYKSADWLPATWYREWWPAMPAFALPSFYDGRIRVNLRGRESAGIVDIADYRRVCDEIEALVRACTDPQTGASVVETVERVADGDDPLALDSASADLVIVWRASPLAFIHPTHGLIGPVPYRRTGGHTGRHGFASITGPGITPGDYGITSSFDVAPTIADFVADRSIDGISGTSLRGRMTPMASRSPSG